MQECEIGDLINTVTCRWTPESMSSESSSSSCSLTRPVQQQWWSWWSSSGPPSPHIISGEAELMKATVRFALVGVCYLSEEHARLSGPPHRRTDNDANDCHAIRVCITDVRLRTLEILIQYEHRQYTKPVESVTALLFAQHINILSY